MMRLLLDTAQETHREHMLRLACYSRLNLLFVHWHNLPRMFQETKAKDNIKRKSENEYKQKNRKHKQHFTQKQSDACIHTLSTAYIYLHQIQLQCIFIMN